MKFKKTKHTPLSAAKALRIGFEEHIAKTWDDYFYQQAEHQRNPNLQGKFWSILTFGPLVKEQANCTAEQAQFALQEVIPELFGEYWEKQTKTA